MKLISTNEAKCRDCYKCIRSCPVKSICIESGQAKTQLSAQVIEESCIHDGLCTLVCPQKAKVVINHIYDVKQLLLEQAVPVLASVAPSFPAMLPLADPAVLPSLLKQLGFSYAGQTAVGAELICAEHQRVPCCRTQDSPASLSGANMRRAPAGAPAGAHYIKRLSCCGQPCGASLPASNSLPVTPGLPHDRPRPPSKERVSGQCSGFYRPLHC